jgi:predicted metal-dependent peptidase
MMAKKMPEKISEETQRQLKNRAVQRFEWLVNFLICRFKFVHQILGMMTKNPSMKVPTMGVMVTADGRFRLEYNPVWLETLTDAEATYVFYHEILHLALLHCTSRALGDRNIAQIACDLAVNELIPITVGVCEPPRDKKGNLSGIFVSEFKKEKMFSDIEEKQTAEWYYDYLRKKIQEKKSGGGGKAKENLDDKGTFDDHDGWNESEVANERAAAKVREVDSLDTWGSIPQTHREIILAAQIRKINWRNLIRVWFGNQAWKDRRYTRKKPNRRTGLMHPGTKRLYVDRWLVAADTSGSVDAELLAEWIGVLNQLAEELPIDFMQFDCDKTQDPRPYERRQTKVEFHGRGGTDFQPVMDIVKQRRYKSVMILTDGEAAEPSRPAMAQVLWVLPVGKNPPCDWGTIIHMQKHV